MRSHLFFSFTPSFFKKYNKLDEKLCSLILNWNLFSLQSFCLISTKICLCVSFFLIERMLRDSREKERKIGKSQQAQQNFQMPRNVRWIVLMMQTWQGGKLFGMFWNRFWVGASFYRVKALTQFELSQDWLF